MEVFEDCTMWVCQVGHHVIVVTAYHRIIMAGNAVIQRIEVTTHVL